VFNNRIRFALLCAVALSCLCARAGSAFGAQLHPRQIQVGAHLRLSTPRRTVRRTVKRVSRATAIARKQEKIVHFARELMGVRYSYGGTSPRTGFDCSGFTRFVYAHFGIVLPHYTVSQFDLGQRVSRAGLRPGDLVFFDGLGHVGLYVGGGRFIHAPHTGTDVEIDSLSGWYGAQYDGARRIV
jgi:cell wall-associated NlpC family hydrolase